MTLAKQNSEQTWSERSLLVALNPEPMHSLPVARQQTCGYQIDQVIQRIDLPEVREIVGPVFQSLLGLLECLDLIESHLRQVDAADETFAIFQEIHDAARGLVEFIRARALSNPLMSEELIDTLDGITFALSHDLQRVFEPGGRARLADNKQDVVVGKLFRAHDVLTNCLQQSTITLAMVFDPEIAGARLFNNSDRRYRQSLQLCEDIAALIHLIEASEKINTPETRHSLTTGIATFRQDSMECLAYSDWPQFEGFSERIVLEAESQGLDSTLHQFRCYLETLLGQVKMRAVLANVFPIQFGEADNSLATSIAEDSPDSSDQQEEQTLSPLALAG